MGRTPFDVQSRLRPKMRWRPSSVGASAFIYFQVLQASDIMSGAVILSANRACHLSMEAPRIQLLT